VLALEPADVLLRVELKADPLDQIELGLEEIDVIESGKPKMLEFGVADEQAWNVGLSCGGTIRVYVEKVS